MSDHVDIAVDEVMEKIVAVGDDMRRFTQAEALQFYDGLRELVQERADVIREEIAQGS